MNAATLSPLLASLLGNFLSLPPLYLALWALLAVLTVALAALMRTEWGRERPTPRYVLLSIVAHLALFCLATTVRFMSAPAGQQSEAPIKVRIVMREPSAPEPVKPQPAPEPVVESEPQPAKPAESKPVTEPIVEPKPAPISAPPLLPAPAEPTPKPVEKAPVEPVKATPVETPAPPLEQMVQQSAPEPTPAPVLPPIEPQPLTPLETLPPIEPVIAERPPSPYGARELADRLKLVEQEGGSRATEDAVAAALAWLASAQSRDGRWDADRWSAGRETLTLGHDRHGAGAQADTGVTGLALLAMLGAGHSTGDGPYAENIRAGVTYLLRVQGADGNLSGDAALYAQTYCHSMATFALAESLATAGDPRLEAAVRRATRRAVDLLVDRQDRSGGGWRYKPGDEGDMSQMGWIIMALRSAELAGIEAPPAVWTSIERFVRSTQRGKAGGLACYQPRGATSRTMTAESLYCRQILGWPTAASPASDEAIGHLLGSLPGQGKPNYYYWYYASLALHHNRTASHAADGAWRAWNVAMSRTLVTGQESVGPLAGSWSPDSLWGGYGGRVYSTALAAMCLEVYYRYDAAELARDPWVAARPGNRLR